MGTFSHAETLMLSESIKTRKRYRESFFHQCKFNPTPQPSHLTNIKRFSEKRDFLGLTSQNLINVHKRV